jgi:hypothetical protein
MKNPDKVGLRGVIKALRVSNDTQKEARPSTSSLDATGAGAAASRSRASRRGGDAGSFMAGAAKQQKEDRKNHGLAAHARGSWASLRKKPPTA